MSLSTILDNYTGILYFLFMVAVIFAIIKFCTSKEKPESEAQHVLRWKQWCFAQLGITFVLMVGLIDWASSTNDTAQIWPSWVPQVTLLVGLASYLYSLTRLPKKVIPATPDAALNVEEQVKEQVKADRWMAANFGAYWQILGKRQQTIDKVIGVVGVVVFVVAASPFMGRAYSVLPLSVFDALLLMIVGLLLVLTALLLAAIQSKAFKNIRN